MTKSEAKELVNSKMLWLLDDPERKKYFVRLGCVKGFKFAERWLTEIALGLVYSDLNPEKSITTYLPGYTEHEILKYQRLSLEKQIDRQ